MDVTSEFFCVFWFYGNCETDVTFNNALFFRNYTTIVSADQRSRYKADFNHQYQEYLKLHSFIEERSRSFTDLEEMLRSEPLGSDEYNVSILDQSIVHHLLLMNFYLVICF